MPVVRGGKVIADGWIAVADDRPVPEDRPVIVPLARWRNERMALAARRAPLGVRLDIGISAADIADDLGHFAIVVLQFPRFSDGRAFSTARLLRERYRFRGEIRAAGHLIRDQLQFLARCGFDSLDAPDESWAEKWRLAQEEISVVYQPAADARRPALSLRHLPPAAQ